MASETPSMLYRTAYRVSLKGLVQLACLFRDHPFVMTHINDSFHATDPVCFVLMPLLVYGLELVAHGVEYAGNPLATTKYEGIALTLYILEVVS
jgi:hypothetical protein